MLDANVDDDSCRLPGCLRDSSSQWYDASAAFDDGCTCGVLVDHAVAGLLCAGLRSPVTLRAFPSADETDKTALEVERSTPVAACPRRWTCRRQTHRGSPLSYDAPLTLRSRSRMSEEVAALGSSM